MNQNKILPISPRERLINEQGDISPRWRLWLEQLQRILGNIGALAWGIIDKTDSSLSDLSARPHSQLQNVYGADITNTGKVIEDSLHVKHVSDAQAAKWDAGADQSGDDQALIHMGL